MENTTINIKREKCLQGICVSNLVVDNGTGRSTNIKFKVVNKSINYMERLIFILMIII